MAWVSPVYNRTSSSYYNTEDIERINNNVQFLVGYIEDYLLYLLSLPHNATTLNKKDFGRATLINQIEDNINSIKDYLNSTINGWQDLQSAWESKSYDFIYTSANNLETDLELLYNVLQNIKTFLDYYRCGTSRIICGGGFPKF